MMVTSVVAPFPESECESVSEYNSRHIGKAWSIVAMTWNGSVYCTRATCAGDWPTYENDLVESPCPVFSSDERGDWCCDNCGGDLF